MYVALIASLVVAAQPAASPPPPAPAARAAPVDPARLAEAHRLLDAEEFEQEALNSAQQVLELMLGTMTEQMQKQTSEPVPDDFLEKLRQTVRDHSDATMRANMPAMKREAAEIYAQDFTREELARLRELAADPVMIKARARNKVMGPKLMMIGARRMRDAQPELEAKIQRLVADHLRAAEKASPERS